MSEKQRMTVPPVTEAQAERAVIDLFRLYDWEVSVLREDIHAGSRGIPDLLCTSPSGVQIWVEVKRPPSSRNPQGRVRKAQKERLIEWRRRGVPCCVADGVTQKLRIVAEFDTRQPPLEALDHIMEPFPWWPA